jgi:hypothetical protein
LNEVLILLSRFDIFAYRKEATIIENNSYFKVLFCFYKTINSQATRIGRNPQTGRILKIAAKTNAKFSPGKSHKDLKTKPVNSSFHLVIIESRIPFISDVSSKKTRTFV